MQDCLGKDELHVYEDPVSNMIVNVQRAGQEFNWHFDTNEFTITMLLQPADQGGEFEHVPELRAPDDENDAGVTAVLDGCHAADIEIVSPTFMNQRQVNDQTFIPKGQRRRSSRAESTPQAIPELMLFDKAEKAASREILLASLAKNLDLARQPCENILTLLASLATNLDLAHQPTDES